MIHMLTHFDHTINIALLLAKNFFRKYRTPKTLPRFWLDETFTLELFARKKMQRRISEPLHKKITSWKAKLVRKCKTSQLTYFGPVKINLMFVTKRNLKRPRHVGQNLTSYISTQTTFHQNIANVDSRYFVKTQLYGLLSTLAHLNHPYRGFLPDPIITLSALGNSRNV